MAFLSAPDICDTCAADEDVFWYCQDCEEVLCHKCKLNHLKNRRTKADRIISILADRKRRVQNSPVILCKKHTTKELNQYCQTCDTLACMMCIHKTHKTHNWIPLEEFKESKEKELNDVVEKLYNQLTIYQNAISNEDKLYKTRITSIEQMEDDVRDQKAKIFEEVTLLSDKQLSQLSAWKQKANKIYSDACTGLKKDCDKVRSVIQTVHNGMDSGDPNTMIQVTREARNTAEKSQIPASVEMDMPQFYRGEVTPSLVVQAQGKVCLKADRSVTPRPQKTIMSKYCQTPKVENTSVKLKRKISLHGEKNSVTVIVPVSKSRAWVAVFGSKRLTLLDKDGEVIKFSDDFAENIEDAKKYNDEMLVTSHKSVSRLSSNGRTLSTFADLAPHFTRGLCVTDENDVLVCLVSKTLVTAGKDIKDSKVVRLGRKGDVIQTIQYDSQGRLLFSVPISITALPGGEFVVVDAKNKERVACFDAKGKLLWMWSGDINGRRVADFSPQRITRGKDSQVFVTDFYNRVFVIEKDGKNARCLVDKTMDIAEPSAIAFNKKGQMMVGADGGKIYVI